MNLDSRYSFAIYIYQTSQKNRVVYHYPNVSVTKEALGELEEYQAKGAKLQVYIDDIESFFEETGCDQARLDAYNLERVKMVNLYTQRKESFNSKKEESFIFKKCFKEVALNKDYTFLRQRLSYELLDFPVDQDPSINFMLALTDKVLMRDLSPVKCAVLAYFMAQELGIKDYQSLSDIILGALFKDLSFCMIKPSSFNSWNSLAVDPTYKKHPFLSLYYLSKLDIPFSKDVKRFIMEHHEDSRGNGYPRGKSEDYIALGSFILNLSEQLVYISEGKMGQEIEFESILRNIISQNKLGEINPHLPGSVLKALEGWVNF